MVILLDVSVIAIAHQGFNNLAWQENLGPYQITVLEDFHLVQNGEGQAKLIVQASHEAKALPEGTKILAKLNFADKIIYEGDIPFVNDSTNDGKTFYSIYALSTGIKEQGIYQLSLTITGPLGEQGKKFLIGNQEALLARLLEFLPSILILLTSIVGLAVLFLPHSVIKRKE